MFFNSIDYLIFFPIVFLIYFLFPAKQRYVWLLVASYYFYFCWNPVHVCLLFAITGITYIGGLLLEKSKNDIRKKLLLIICVLSSLGTLFVFKYSGFVIDNLNKIMNWNVSTDSLLGFDIMLPVGISYYTFQVVGYIVDIYRGNIQAEKNFLKYSLYVSFFPKMVSGPIERSKNLLQQLQKPVYFNEENVRIGLLTMAYGLVLKVVAADNIAAVINPVLGNYQEAHGIVIMAAVILFGFQIYFDFQGYTLLALGSAKVLGYDMLENFNSPYWAGSVREFWQRWHISLTSWFREYLYIPLGGNRKGKIRKHFNTMIVFLVSGLWHGAGWNFIVWGGLNGLYLVLQDITSNVRKKIYAVLKIDQNSLIWKGLTRIVTFALIDIAWLFFKAGTIDDAILMLKIMVVDFNPLYLLSDGFFSMFGSTRNFAVICLLIIIIMLLDYFKYKKIDLKSMVFNQKTIVRWMIYISIILCILLIGNYGGEYEQTQFIYFQF